MSDTNTTIDELKKEVSKFINERDWEKFHSPKNLSMCIAIEAAELMEKFQWLDSNESIEEIKKNRLEVEEELADIVNAVLCFCKQYNIDLTSAILNKLDINKKKYPIEKSKGKSTKYNKIK